MYQLHPISMVNIIKPKFQLKYSLEAFSNLKSVIFHIIEGCHSKTNLKSVKVKLDLSVAVSSIV